MAQEQVGFVLTPTKVGFYVSLLTLLTAVYTGVSVFVNLQYRVVILETAQSESVSRYDKLGDKIDALAETLNAFNLTLRELQVRQGIGK